MIAHSGRQRNDKRHEIRYKRNAHLRSKSPIITGSKTQTHKRIVGSEDRWTEGRQEVTYKYEYDERQIV